MSRNTICDEDCFHCKFPDCRLPASRVCELRRAGHQIRAINETGLNRYGERTSYARYVLEEV